MTKHFLFAAACLVGLSSAGSGQWDVSGHQSVVNPPQSAPVYVSSGEVYSLFLKTAKPVSQAPAIIQVLMQIDSPSVSTAATATTDQLFDRLTVIRARKAALEREEQATIAAIQEQLNAERRRLSQLGGCRRPPATEK